MGHTLLSILNGNSEQTAVQCRRKGFDMDVQAKVRAALAAAPLGSEKRQSLQFILGELSTAAKCLNGEATLKKLLEENERAKRRTRHRKELERIDAENAILRSLLTS
jgi:hypothetical protein